MQIDWDSRREHKCLKHGQPEFVPWQLFSKVFGEIAGWTYKKQIISPRVAEGRTAKTVFYENLAGHFYHLAYLLMAFLPSGIFTNVIFTIWHFYHWHFYHPAYLPMAFLPYGIFTNGIFTYGNLTYGIFTNDIFTAHPRGYEVKTADSLPFANQQQPNTSRDAKVAKTGTKLTCIKNKMGRSKSRKRFKKTEFTLTPIKTGEKTGLQKIAKVGTRRESLHQVVKGLGLIAFFRYLLKILFIVISNLE